MGFFDDVLAKAVKQTAESHPLPESRTNSARRSRASILPGQLAWSRKLAQGEAVCVALTGLRCWPEFAEMSITTYFHDGEHGSAQPERLPLALHRFHADAEGSLRFGVLFADGRYATNLDRIKWQEGAPRDPSADQPVLLVGGGTGRPGYVEEQIDIFPLPPAKPVTLIVEWPGQGIAETRTEVDGAEIRAAAARATGIWTETP